MEKAQTMSKGGTTPLSRGAQLMYEKQMYTDFVIAVGGMEFHVHKFVLLATSDYFRRLLDSGMKECQTGRLEVKHLTPSAVSAMLNFMYYDSFGAGKADNFELLECAVYWHVEDAIELSSWQIITEDLTAANWYAVFCLFEAHGLQAAAARTKSSVRDHFDEFIADFKPENATAVKCVAELWEKSEIELYIYIADWVRDSDSTSLFSLVRFGLMTAAELEQVKLHAKGRPWEAAVMQALAYSRSKPNEKVTFYGETDQNATRGTPETLAFYDVYAAESAVVSQSFIVVLDTFGRHSETHTKESWWLFDARTNDWWKMSPPSDGRRCKAAWVCHKGSLYALGGLVSWNNTGQSENDRYFFCGFNVSNGVQKYDFATDCWSEVPHMNLPVPMAFHGAAMVKDALYVAGGVTSTDRERKNHSYRLAVDVLDMGKNNGVWDRLPSPIPVAPKLTVKLPHRGGESCQLHALNQSLLLYLSNSGELMAYDLCTLGPWQKLVLPAYDLTYLLSNDCNTAVRTAVSDYMLYVFLPEYDLLYKFYMDGTQRFEVLDVPAEVMNFSHSFLSVLTLPKHCVSKLHDRYDLGLYLFNTKKKLTNC